MRDEYTRTIEPARALAAETLTLERTLSDLVNPAYGLISSEKMRQPIAGPGLARTPKDILKQ